MCVAESHIRNHSIIALLPHILDRTHQRRRGRISLSKALKRTYRNVSTVSGSGTGARQGGQIGVFYVWCFSKTFQSGIAIIRCISHAQPGALPAV